MLLEEYKVVELYKGAASTLGAAGFTDYVCCKNAHSVEFLIQHSGANDTDLTAIGLIEATDVAAGTAANVAVTFPIWSKDQASYLTSDGWDRETDAVAYTPLDPALKGDTRLWFYWDPAKHTAGYDCIAVRAVGGHASNFVVVTAFIKERYKQADPPSAIVD